MATRSSAEGSRTRSATLQTWLPALFAVFVASLALFLLLSTVPPQFPKSPLWPLLIAAFAIGESTVVHFEFRQQTVSWTVTEIPVVIGLLVFGPVPTVIARAVVIALVLAFGHYSAPKIVFNVCVAVMEVALAGWAIEIFGLTDVTQPSTWFGIIAALLVTGALGTACIALAILLSGGSISRDFWSTLAIPQLFLTPTTATVGVIVLLLLEISPWSGLLATFMLGLFVLLYRKYAAAAQDKRSLAEVYAFAELVENAGSDNQSERVILDAVREKLNAARAALWIPASLDQGPRRLGVVGPGVKAAPEWTDPDDPIRLEITAGDQASLIHRSKASSGQLAGLDGRRVNELIGVPLDTEADEPGYLEVCDRNGSVLQFSNADVELMQSLATHVAAAVRQRQLLDKIRYDAAHDQVTDLPNRFWLIATVDAQLAAAPAQSSIALLIADVDGFAQVNETLGYAAGDELLQVISAALAEHAPPEATLARVGGAQFAVVLRVAHLEEAERAAAELREAVSTRVLVAGLQLTAELTLGVAVAPLHGDSAATLLQCAEVALLAARSRGQSSAPYDATMDEQSMRRLRLGADLADAIESAQMSVVFQPIVGTGKGEIAAVELLTRWKHPRLGEIVPDEFIPLAERIGLITPLTRRVLRTAFQRCQEWLDEGVVISMAVNLSPVTLAEPGFIDEVAHMLRDSAFPAELLTFEITEGAVISDGLAIPALTRLHELGVGLSVDDFGTGYSSLSRLRQLPIDEVKIDKSFVLAMSTDPGTNTIARSIIELAHNLGLRVVAEGVEDELTRDLLANMNCDFLQGYLVSRPLTAASLVTWLDARTATQPVDEDRSRRKLYIIR
ncbi:MAG: EAL domain-containing protein [Actinomycetota bacterium]|nr:EAL domain-containing protein [Actinomycetota bacterium]